MSENNFASRGDFRGDFSRDTFDQMKHFSRVLMQQGRVQLDADWNEQVSILLHYMRQLGRDLMGPHGAPYPDDETPTEANFAINPVVNQIKPDFSIAPGRYYVNGILCEIGKEQQFTYLNQPNYPIAATKKLGNGIYLVYLDVWERHITYVEDDSMREKALGGADTTTRAKVVWQVKIIQQDKLNKDYQNNEQLKSNYDYFSKALPFAREEKQKPKLKARARKASEEKNEPCLTSPEATYRGTENQLYRVEIHKGGPVGTATFKWSRENGSVVFPVSSPIINSEGTVKVTIDHFGRDDRFSLQQGDWLEVLDDDVILRNEAYPLLQVKDVDREEFCVTLDLNDDTKDTVELLAVIAKDIKEKNDKHPYLRRWDQKKGAASKGVEVTEDEKEQDWISIEDGLEIQFQKQDAAVYQTGDYWLIPARTATGDVEWPVDPVDHTKPAALPPHGVVHHYAPLAIITVADNKVKEDTQGEPDNLIDLRRQLKQGWE